MLPSFLRRFDSRWISGAAGVLAAGPSHVIFQAVGQKVLPLATRRLGARVATQVAAQVGLGAPLEVQAFVRVADAGVRELAAMPSAASTSLAVTRTAALGGAASRPIVVAAARNVGIVAGRAAALGLVLDGGLATIDAVRSVRSGEATREQAVRYVAKEAFSGAVATGAGVLAVSAVVALTGGLGAPAAFFLGAGASMSVKHLLKRALS
jgi:hypothetical protein